MRVLPDSHPRVPEEQIEKILRRKRRLYQDDPIPMPPVLNDSFKDLQKDSELRELGTALFLDRSSILLSHLAFSRNIAHQRLQWFCQQELLTQEQLAALETRLEHLQVNGIGLDQIQTARQPGTVSVLDAAQVSDDFVYFRTTDSSMEELRQQHQFPTSIRLLLPSWDEEVNRPILVGYDQAMSKQWVLKE